MAGKRKVDVQLALAVLVGWVRRWVTEAEVVLVGAVVTNSVKRCHELVSTPGAVAIEPIGVECIEDLGEAMAMVEP